MDEGIVALLTGLALIAALVWIFAPYFLRRPKPQHRQRELRINPPDFDWPRDASKPDPYRIDARPFFEATADTEDVRRPALSRQEEELVDLAVADVMRRRRLPKTWTDYLAERRIDPKRRP
jgi:hypothetical protein